MLIALAVLAVIVAVIGVAIGRPDAVAIVIAVVGVAFVLVLIYLVEQRRRSG